MLHTRILYPVGKGIGLNVHSFGGSGLQVPPSRKPRPPPLAPENQVSGGLGAEVSRVTCLLPKAFPRRQNFRIAFECDGFNYFRFSAFGTRFAPQVIAASAALIFCKEICAKSSQICEERKEERRRRRNRNRLRVHHLGRFFFFFQFLHLVF